MGEKRTQMESCNRPREVVPNIEVGAPGGLLQLEEPEESPDDQDNKKENKIFCY